MVSPTHGYVTKGSWADTPAAGDEIPIHTTSRWQDNWFVYQIKDTLTSQTSEVYMPTCDYIHRHTSGIFWELSYLCFFSSWTIPRNMLGWLWPPKIADAKRMQPRIALDHYFRTHVVQDYLLPMEHLSECLRKGRAEIDVFPIWICPYNCKAHLHRGLLHPHADHDRMYVDVGYYGPSAKPGFDMESALRNMEAWMLEKDAYVMLYAQHRLLDE